VLVGQAVNDPLGGFPDGATKLAYLERAIDLPHTLPVGPTTAVGYRLITARDALASFMSGAGKGPSQAGRLAVTSVVLATAVFQTDRGRIPLPAWQLSFQGVKEPAAVLAVSPTSIFSPPGHSDDRPGIVSDALLGPDGRSLTVEFTGAAAGTGPCTADYTLEVATSATAVAVSVQEHAHNTGSGVACPAIGYPRHVTTVLSVPLGARVVVDASTTSAVAVSTSG
jgi:hypothetical protein